MSDILIKGMEMPKTCHCCRMCVQVSDGDIDWHWECCLLCEKVARYSTDRIPGCPLFPVPPHDRLIEYHAACHAVYDGYKEFGLTWRNAEVMLGKLPTIIQAEEETCTKNL